MTPVALYEMFPFLNNNERLASDHTDTRVVSVTLNTAKTQMDINLSFANPIPPYELSVLEELISSEYGMDIVNIGFTVTASPGIDYEQNGTGKQTPAPKEPQTTEEKLKASITKAMSISPHEKARAAAAAQGNQTPKPVKKAIMGRVTKTKPKTMSEVVIDDGRVTIRGHVCDVRSRVIERNNSMLLSFDLTDYTSTINVSKFLDEINAKKIMESVKKGMYLTVSGSLRINNHDGEMILTPSNIFESDYEERTDNAEAKRVELHLHTKRSKDGLIHVMEAVQRAAKWGHRAIAITDHGVVHSFPAAAAAAKKTDGKVKVLYGVEGYLYVDVAPDGTKLPGQATKKTIYHVILLAKDQTGLKNMYKLVSFSHLDNIYNKRPVINKSTLIEHREGLIIGSACERGEFFTAITSGKDDETLCEIARFYDYLEIQPVCNNRFMILSDKYTAKNDDDLRAYNMKAAEIGKMTGIPVTATTDCHFLDPEHEIFRKIILAAEKYSGADDELPLFLRTTDEMLEEFDYLGSDLAHEIVVTNTNKIADMCGHIEPVPHEFYIPELPGSADELYEMLHSKLDELYGKDLPAMVTERVDSELKNILSRGYDVIYMAAQKSVAFLNSKGSRVGSRGSVGSSLVAYLVGITEVNPLPAHYRCPNCKKVELPGMSVTSMAYSCGADMPEKECSACGSVYLKEGFNIPFETFLGFGGDKIPDIDLNISGEWQSSAWDFVYDLFGRDYVYRAGTITKIAKENAFKMVKDYVRDKGRVFTRAEENRLINGLIGVKRTTGQHPGGLVVVPKDMEIYDFTPIQHPADDGEKKSGSDSPGKVITTHFEYEWIEDNLIKLDMLGHANPTMLCMLERLTGVNADDIRLDDPDTLSIFSSPAALGLPEDDDIIGETGSIGIPEFGTPFVREMLCDTRPKDFETLVRLAGYAHGTDVWLNNAKDLIASGKVSVAETISSRDDIMLFLISKGMDAVTAFSISESVRKGKGVPKGKDKKMFELGVPGWYIDSCNKISYLFPRAHSVAYVIMSFRIAWFKVHRPLEYYSAHFYRRSIKNSSFDAFTMTDGIDTVRAKIREFTSAKKNEMTAKDIRVLTTLESCYEFYMRGFDFVNIDLYQSDATMFLPVYDESGKGFLRPPFIAVGGLGDRAALSLAENRKGRRFISMEEITASCPGVNKSNVTDLERLGAFKNLPESSQMSLF